MELESHFITPESNKKIKKRKEIKHKDNHNDSFKKIKKDIIESKVNQDDILLTDKAVENYNNKIKETLSKKLDLHLDRAMNSLWLAARMYKSLLIIKCKTCISPNHYTISFKNIKSNIIKYVFQTYLYINTDTVDDKLLKIIGNYYKLPIFGCKVLFTLIF